MTEAANLPVPAADAETSATLERRMMEVGLYNPDLDFEKLALEAQYFTKGFQLVEKTSLVGIPHVVTAVTYRPGFPREGKEADYVSLEAVVATERILKSMPVRVAMGNRDIDDLPVYPNQAVVYNDSGTGIRRYLTELFHNAGIIDVGSHKGDGSPFDKPYQQWKSGADLATTGIVADPDGQPFRLMVMRGLRISDYEWNGQPARTFYFG